MSFNRHDGKRRARLLGNESRDGGENALLALDRLGSGLDEEVHADDGLILGSLHLLVGQVLRANRLLGLEIAL